VGGIGKATAAAVLLAGLAVAGAPAASADTLLYAKPNGVNDNIWISKPDGSEARMITPASDTFGWPSQSDNGTIVAEGPGAGLDGRPSLLGDFYVMDTSGKVDHRVLTDADGCALGNRGLPAQNVRISPDAARIAYFEFSCAKINGTWWIPTSAGHQLTPNQTLGQYGQGSPVWKDNSHLLLSAVAEPSFGAGFSTYTVGDGDGTATAWFSDPASYQNPSPGGWAFTFEATISRQGDKLAVIAQDGNSPPQRVELRAFTSTGPPPAPPTFKCALTLAPATPSWTYLLASPSFSPDGTRVAFAEPDGVHIANLSNLSDCSSMTAPLVIPDARQPFWSAAALPPRPGPGPGPSPSPGTNPGAPVLSALRIGPTALRKRHVNPSISYTDSQAATTTLTVHALKAGIKRGSRCVASTGKPKHRSKKCNTRDVVIGSFTHRDAKGSNSLSLPASIRRALGPGRYQLSAIARGSAGSSQPVAVPFTVA
jgi:hypothetical protein